MKIAYKMFSNNFFILLVLLLVMGASNSLLAQTTYYSQGNAYLGITTNWNTIRTGGGSSPVSIGNDIFVIQNTHSITNDATYTINALTVETGGSFINGATSIGRTININNDVTVDGTLDFYRGTINTDGDFSVGTTGRILFAAMNSVFWASGFFNNFSNISLL